MCVCVLCVVCSCECECVCVCVCVFVCAMTVDVNSCSIATEYCMWTVETIGPATYVFQPSYSNCTGH